MDVRAVSASGGLPEKESRGVSIGLIPRDAYHMQLSMREAAGKARQAGFFSARFWATLYAVHALGCAIVNTPWYFLKGLKCFAREICHLQLREAVNSLGREWLRSGQSLFLIPLGVAYVALGIFFPQTVFLTAERWLLPVLPPKEESSSTHIPDLSPDPSVVKKESEDHPLSEEEGPSSEKEGERRGSRLYYTPPSSPRLVGEMPGENEEFLSPFEDSDSETLEGSFSRPLSASSGSGSLGEEEASSATLNRGERENLTDNEEVQREEGQEYFAERAQSGLLSWFSQWISEENHPSKLQKYREALGAYIKEGNKYFTWETEYKQLKELCQADPQNELYARTYRVLQLLLADIPGLDLKPRERYQQFVLALREAIQLDAYQDPLQKGEGKDLCKKIIQTLCYIRWTKAALFGYLKEVTDLLLAGPNGAQESLTSTLTAVNFAERLAKANKAIKEAPMVYKKPRFALEKQKAQGTLQLKDYTAQENIPYVRLWQVYQNDGGENREIGYLRHGSPTTAGYVINVGINLLSRLLGFSSVMQSGEAIAPDYEVFVQQAGANGQGVLYVIHQRLRPDRVEDESERVRVIRALETSYPNFHALVQPVEGPLFEMTNDYAYLTTFDELKTALWENIFGETDFSRFALPLSLENEERYKGTVIPHLLEDVHTLFFNGKKEIASLEEWQTFILLFYVFQKLDLKFRLGNKEAPIAFYTTACKDFLDRGGNMALVEDFVHAYWLGQEDNPELLEMIFYNILGAPILVKRKEVIASRLKPGLFLIDYLARYFKENPGKKEELRAYSFGEQKWRAVHCSLSSQSAPLRENLS